jgi:hypothetical protein
MAPRFYTEQPPCSGCVFIGSRGDYDYYRCTAAGNMVVEVTMMEGVRFAMNCHWSTTGWTERLGRAVRGRFLSKCLLVHDPWSRS